MPLLHVALQEGFVDDTVVVQVNSRDVFRKDAVKTRLQIGFADSIEVAVEGSTARVQVLLPRKNLAEAITVSVAADTYLGVSVQEGKIHYRTSREPFGYV